MLHLLCERHEEVGYARHCLPGLVSLAHESLHTAGVLLGLVIGPGVDALDDPGLGLLPDQSGEQRGLLRLHHLHPRLGPERPGGEDLAGLLGEDGCSEKEEGDEGGVEHGWTGAALAGTAE